MSAAAGRWLLVGAGVVVAGAVIAAIVAIGTPAQQRLLRQDERRERDLISLKVDIEIWAERNEALPPNLSALARPGSRPAMRDPFTSRPYEYEVLGARRYRLCAMFDSDTAERDVGGQWRHPRGRQCFDLKLPDPAKVEP
ncbi:MULTISPECIES: hypothetical protein [unclassified Lysobacter]|uniref:hypothetical protein n=1 Tax=unclassified Lysobacter TaxID=2635362 RepID=UPI001C24CC74|nr:hypothetical protein [Lysobacter sp. MMG2]MBU8974829.1 hypothetical protein [Lysobacter sp. MMG2]